MATYPADRENDVVLRDGSTVHVRPSRPGDAPEVERLLELASSWSGVLLLGPDAPEPMGHPALPTASRPLHPGPCRSGSQHGKGAE